MPKFIGIKQLWYQDVVVDDLTAMADVTKLISGGKIGSGANDKTYTAATEIKNSHQDTWGYTQDDPSVDDYINELTGKPYYRDKTTDGNKTISFTMGEYDYATKAALQGGTVISAGSPSAAVGWKAPTVPTLVNKAIIALTRTGNYIIFTNANIIAKGDQQQKAVGLGVVAVAQENPTTGVADEYFFTGTDGV